MSARIEVGTSGFSYPGWRPGFYPEGLARSRWLRYYSDRFTTVEMNSTFYRLPSAAAVEGWYDATPDQFCFSVKASRFITHVKRLKESAGAVKTFAERVSGLREKLGPILFQLPPGMTRSDERLASFLDGLTAGHLPVFEFRHPSWFGEVVFDLLRRHQAGFCIFDMPGMPCPVEVTADFAYLRFHGTGERYGGSYGEKELAGWAEKINGLSERVRAIYVYFNNDVGGYAVENAGTLLRLLRKA